MLRSSGQKAFPWGKVAEWSEVGWGKEETTSSPLRGLSLKGKPLPDTFPQSLPLEGKVPQFANWGG